MLVYDKHPCQLHVNKEWWHLSVPVTVGSRCFMTWSVLERVESSRNKLYFYRCGSFCQVVPRPFVGEGGWEAADGEREERQLPGEREPEPSGGFRSVGSYRRRQDGQQWQQTQSHSCHDPLPGKRTPHHLCVSLLTARCMCTTAMHADVKMNYCIPTRIQMFLLLFLGLGVKPLI